MRLAILLTLSAAILFASIGYQWHICSDAGGIFVRGLFGYECLAGGG